MVIIPNIHFSFRKGGGSAPEIIYGKVEIRPTTPFQASTSLVLPAPTTIDLINGEGTAPNVYPTPAPVNGQVEWAYRVKVTDRHGKTFEWMVGVPDTTGTVEFASLPRYYETKPPLFGQGPKGDPGQAATISIGTTTSGTTPSVTNSGTNQAAVLNFVLPKGDKGDTGAGVPAGGTALQIIRKNAGNTATEWATLDKAAVGLGNADNTSDANKPVSTATQSALTALENRTDANVSALIDSGLSATYSAIAARFVKVNDIVVNVKDFGAIGDGVTDDRVSVLTALDELAANGGGTLLFPAGHTFIWSDVLALEPKHSNILLSGYGASIGKIAGAARYAIFSSRSMGAKGYGSGVRNVVFEGIRFFGDLPTGRDACAFAGNHAENVMFKHCVFDGMHGQGHIIDLAGCRNINFAWCDFLGTTLGKTGNYLRSEAIQLDISAAGAASAPDTNGSWDGLPTVGVSVEFCQFLPKVVGTTTYPAPKPIGAHARRENAYFDNVKFMYNYILDPLFDVTSELPGDIHFVGAKNVKVMYNTWKLTTPAAHIAIGFYSYDRGTLADANNEPSETPNPVVQVSPQPYLNIEVSHNSFYGFSAAALDRGYIQFKNFATNFTTVIGDTVKVHNNTYENVSGGAGMQAVLIEDTKNVKQSGESVKGNVRALQARRVTNLGISSIENNSGTTQTLNLTGCNGFSITGCTLIAAGSLSGILVDSTSANGVVTGNSITGGSTNPTQIAGTNVLASINVVS